MRWLVSLFYCRYILYIWSNSLAGQDFSFQLFSLFYNSSFFWLWGCKIWVFYWWGLRVCILLVSVCTCLILVWLLVCFLFVTLVFLALFLTDYPFFHFLVHHRNVQDWKINSWNWTCINTYTIEKNVFQLVWQMNGIMYYKPFGKKPT